MGRLHDGRAYPDPIPTHSTRAGAGGQARPGPSPQVDPGAESQEETLSLQPFGVLAGTVGG
jgi:hypothetical protein